MDTIGKRIRYARKQKHWRQVDLAAHIDVSSITIANLEANRFAKPETVRKVAEATGVEYVWVMTGNKAMSPHNDMVRLSIIDIMADRGEGVSVPATDEIYDVLTVTKDWVVRNLDAKDTQYHHIIFANGDTMAPTFNNDDMLIINTKDKKLCDGLWLLKINNCLYAKRVQVAVDDSKVTLISDNSLYPAQEVDKGKNDIEVIGKIAKVMPIQAC